MSESYIQLPPDGSGKRVRAIKRIVSDGEIYERVTLISSPDGTLIDPRDSSLFFKPTYSALVHGSTAGANKVHLLLFNPSDNVKTAYIVRISVFAELTATVTGYTVGFRVARVTSYSGGTSATIISYDVNDPSSGLTAVTTPSSIVQESIIYALAVNPEESGGSSYYEWIYNGIGKPIVLYPGYGIAVVQYATAGTGTYDIVITFITP